MDAEVDAQDIQEPEGPRTEVLEVLTKLAGGRLAGRDPQGDRKVGLKDRPLSCLASRLVSSGLERRAGVLKGRFVISQSDFLSESVGQFAAEDGEATGASFRTGVWEGRRA
jgi:hypothetical protein